MKIVTVAMLIALAAPGAAAQTLPSGFGVAHIGAPALSGSASYSGGSVSVRGAGTDIWHQSDQFTYLYRQMTGDGVIVARVAALQHAHEWSKAGIMVRESLTAHATHAFALVSGARGVAFQQRLSTGGSSTHIDGGAGTAPVWLRLERRGSTFTASRSADGSGWTRIGSVTIAMTSRVYVGLAVTSHRADARATASFSQVMMPGYATPGALPAGWTSTLVGAPGVAGTASAADSRVTVRGLGADVWGTADQFMFVHRPLSGDGAIVARVADLQHVDQWSKAGVMVRESLSAQATHAFALVSGSRGVAYQRRRATGGASVHTDGGAGSSGVWLRIERRGSSFTMSRSADGVAWTVVGTESMSMPATVYVGLAVTSHRLEAAAMAAFTHVRVASAAGGTLPAESTSAEGSGPANAAPMVSLTSPASGATFTAPASIPVAASATDADGSITRVDFYHGSTLIGSRAAAPFSLTWRDVPGGTYSVVAVARDSAGASTVSGQRIVYVQEPQLPGRALFVPSLDHATSVTFYRLEIFPVSADPRVANPVATQDLGKPAIVNGECAADVSHTIALLPSGTYVAVVAAVGAGGTTRSAPSAPFTR